MSKPSRRTKKTFAQVLDSVIATAYENAEPIASSSKEIVIGDLTVINDGVCYSIADKATGEIKFDHVYLIEAAFLIAKYIQLKDFREVDKVMKLENAYAKHYMDLMFHYNSCKQARESDDYKKLEIFQIRYRDSKSSANHLKLKIRNLCDVILKKR